MAASPRKSVVAKAATMLSPRGGLPENWHKRKDEFGREFYWNSVTFKQSFERPVRTLPSGWHERRDPVTGVIYHYNFWTRETHLPPAEAELPPPPPPEEPPPTVEEYLSKRASSLLVTSDGGEEPTPTGHMKALDLNALPREPTGLVEGSAPPMLMTPRAAAKHGVPVALDPFSLTARWHGANLGAEGLQLKPPGPPPGPPPGSPPGPPPGAPPVPATGAELKAAASIQAHTRGLIERKSVEDMRDEKARQQWIAFYLERSMYKQARDMCWEPENEEQAKAEAATLLQAAQRGVSSRRLTASSSDEAAKVVARSILAPARVVTLVNAAAAYTAKKDGKMALPVKFEDAAAAAAAGETDEAKQNGCSVM